MKILLWVVLFSLSTVFAFPQDALLLDSCEGSVGNHSANHIPLPGGDYTHVGSGATLGRLIVLPDTALRSDSLHASQSVDLLSPSCDTDADGICNEIDPDNDNDGLSDLAECNGSAFSPMTPTDLNVSDTDGDGVTDYDETIHGTNPQDAESALKISAIHMTEQGPAISWSGRGNNEREYTILSQDNLTDSSKKEFVNIRIAEEGEGEWHEATGNCVIPHATEQQFFSIKVSP